MKVIFQVPEDFAWGSSLANRNALYQPLIRADGARSASERIGGVISRIDLRGDALPEGPALRDLLPRADFDVSAALEKVRPICEAVHHRGDAALIDFAEKFDGVRLESVRVPARAITDALETLDPTVRAALEESIRRARLVHREQRRTTHTTQVAPGGTVTEKWVPVDRVGLYAPGGRSVYPSTVVMNVVPAQEAGVESIALASPAQAEFDGLPHPTILAACALLGVDEVYAAGGATAVAMFAYGTESCAPTNMVMGPGNIWVAAAKRYFAGKIGIDTEAGPTEIAILADDTADPVHVAADLISQAEHDPLAAAVLVTDSVALADAVEKELEPQVAATRHIDDRIVPALAGRQSAIALSTESRRACGSSTRTAPSTWRSRQRTPRPWPTGYGTPVRSSSAPGRRSPSATTRPGPTTSCRPAAAPATPPVSPSSPSCAASTSSTTRGTRWPTWRITW